MKATSLGFQHNLKPQARPVIEVINPVPEESKVVKTQSSSNKLILGVFLTIFLLMCAILLAIWYYVVSTMSSV